MAAKMSLKPPKRVLIVGCGEFGSAFALSLIKGAYKDRPDLITLLDRSATPPEVDAACYDFNKIVRQEYADPIYARLAHDAMDLWRTDEWKRNYYESGIIVSVKHGARQSKYISSALATNAEPGMETPGLKAYTLQTREEVEKEYPENVPLGDFADQNVYINQAGGWAHSRGAVVDTVARLRQAGVRFAAGEAKELVLSPGSMDVKGVKCSNGTKYTADLTVLCMGSWTPLLLPELGNELLPTGQVLGTIQLSEEETRRYKDAPVTRLIDNGFYIFPPTSDGVLKFAIHQKGYLSPTQGLPSAPRTALSKGYEDQQVPPAAAEALHTGLKRVYPELAEREWINSRICWYSDRPSGDWLIDYHERYQSLFVAAGCCGHAFKFMPLLGDLILQGIERRLSTEHSDIWAYTHRVPGRKDASRDFSEYQVLRGKQQDARL